VAVAWTALALLGASTFSTIGLLTTTVFRIRDEMTGLRGEVHDLRAEMRIGFTDQGAAIRALGDRLTAAGA
jgi:hypothetical protein